MKQESFQFYNTSNTIQTANLVIQQVWPFLSGIGSFLDFGCGMSSWSQALEKMGFQIF